VSVGYYATPPNSPKKTATELNSEALAVL
jgi:hypothetical protein